MSDKARELLKQKEDLKLDKSNYSGTFEDISYYIRMERQGITAPHTEGDERTKRLCDPTAANANDRLAASLRYMLTDINSQFFYLSTGEDELDSDFDVKSYLDDCSAIMLSAFQDSNFDTVSDECYLDLGSFATDCMYFEEGKDTLYNFRSISPADFVFTEDAQGMPDAAFVSYTYTLIQAAKEFGVDNLHSEYKSDLVKCPNRKANFTHIVMRRENADLSKLLSTNLPWASYWIDDRHTEIIEERGYNENPYCISRWRKASNTVWGFGPGHKALPTIRVANTREEVNLSLERKYANPPLWAEEGSVDGPLRTGSGRVNWGRKNTNQPVPMLTVNPSGMSWSESQQQKYQDYIFDMFYVTQLSLIDRTKMTATEVNQRTEENMRVMGPTFGRLIREKLDRIINRAYGIAARAGLFPEPPEALVGRNLKIRYESPLARAQKGTQSSAMYEAMSFAAQLAEFKGSGALHRINEKKWVDKFMELKGIPSSINNSDDEIETIMQSENDARIQQQQMEAMQLGAATGKDMADAQAAGGM